jgi:hypothetical protein
MQGFYETYYKTFEVIDFALQKGYSMPALILTYSLIDSYSWLCESNDTHSVSNSSFCTICYFNKSLILSHL